MTSKFRMIVLPQYNKLPSQLLCYLNITDYNHIICHIDLFLASVRKSFVKYADLYLSVDALAQRTTDSGFLTEFGGKSGGDISEPRRVLLTYRRQ